MQKVSAGKYKICFSIAFEAEGSYVTAQCSVPSIKILLIFDTILEVHLSTDIRHWSGIYICFVYF